jgi:hypothetical protein
VGAKFIKHNAIKNVYREQRYSSTILILGTSGQLHASAALLHRRGGYQLDRHGIKNFGYIKNREILDQSSDY